MDDKLFAVRFDVDTHRCVREGMPNLLDLAGELDIRFTFFVNMGRAVDRGHSLRALVGGRPQGPVGADRLSARTKLGLGGYLTAAVANPLVGAGSPEVVRRAAEEGHEIGLHGGTNHQTWQAEALTWPTPRLAGEVDAGLELLRDALGGEPRGFASPGWQGPPSLGPVLAARGFDYVADLHGPGDPMDRAEDLVRVRTELTGEPEGVAYLEHQRAVGRSTDEIVDDVEGRLADDRPFLVMYDHPYHAGIHELATLSAVVERARDRGYRIVPIADMVDRWRARA